MMTKKIILTMMIFVSGCQVYYPENFTPPSNMAVNQQNMIINQCKDIAESGDFSKFYEEQNQQPVYVNQRQEHTMDCRDGYANNVICTGTTRNAQDIMPNSSMVTGMQSMMAGFKMKKQKELNFNQCMRYFGFMDKTENSIF